jgi:hypothetical protein
MSITGIQKAAAADRNQAGAVSTGAGSIKHLKRDYEKKSVNRILL